MKLVDHGMIVVKYYPICNSNHFGRPWIAKIGPNGWPDFSTVVGGFIESTVKDKPGALIIYQPEDGAFYMYGQKNYHKPKYSERRFVQYKDGKLIPATRAEMVRTIYTKRVTK